MLNGSNKIKKKGEKWPLFCTSGILFRDEESDSEGHGEMSIMFATSKWFISFEWTYDSFIRY